MGGDGIYLWRFGGTDTIRKDIFRCCKKQIISDIEFAQIYLNMYIFVEICPKVEYTKDKTERVVGMT